MASERGEEHDPKHLTVLPYSGKVQQLQQESESSQSAIPPIRTATDPAHTDSDPNYTPEQKALEQKVIEALRTIFDPEIPVNIYELGLIYAIVIDPDLSVQVRMTLTAPACPVAGTLPGEVEKKVKEVPGVKNAIVELVWNPPWSREMMSEVAQLQLGIM